MEFIWGFIALLIFFTIIEDDLDSILGWTFICLFIYFAIMGIVSIFKVFFTTDTTIFDVIFMFFMAFLSFIAVGHFFPEENNDKREEEQDKIMENHEEKKGDVNKFQFATECQSCGATDIIKSNNQYICAYCKSILYFENS